jgi:hypothetical protein
VIIVEAGMADTLSLDAAVEFAIDRGASVRLVGDDQQLAAIGAGGVLRDIKHQHGVVQLAELHRFTNPAEEAASLALREGKPGALDFYLDHGRVHVGDIAKTTEDAFTAWVLDRSAGLDAIMLAPTRELVAQLNRRARDHRLNGNVPNAVVRLADGNQASVRDVIITRANDRRLRLTATDWVKNGDRWTITRIGRRGDLTVRHTRSQLTVRLPNDYVRTSTGLGFATTIHSAQGVTADTMHGLLTGQESRQQLYTMLTRGRHANHLYLQVVGDGDPHTLIRPDTIAPRTPTETLQQILARDEAPVSASSLLRELNNPAARLFQAVQRYIDGLHVAAEQLVGPQTVAELNQADRYVPGLTTEPAWPTLRAHLLALAAETGKHPLLHLLTAASGRDLHTAGDMAAVLYWRLTALTPTNPGPLPWLPHVPHAIQDHPVWGNYLAKRSQLVADLADQVQDHACQGDGPPVWARPGSHPSTALVGEIAVWRAANGINPQDPRPTGGTHLETLPALWKQHLDWDIARATYPPADARADERQAGRTTLGPSDDPYQKANGVGAGRPRPADSTPPSSDRGALRMRLYSTRRWQDRQQCAELRLLSQATTTSPWPRHYRAVQQPIYRHPRAIDLPHLGRRYVCVGVVGPIHTRSMRNLAQLTGHSDDMAFPSVAHAYTPVRVGGAVSSTTSRQKGPLPCGSRWSMLSVFAVTAQARNPCYRSALCPCGIRSVGATRAPR